MRAASSIGAFLLLASPAVAIRAADLGEADCAALTSLAIEGTTIASAKLRTAGGTLPEFCRLRGTVEAEIQFEIRLPTATWNGKLYHAGGGAYVGYLPVSTIAVERGYATVATDTGHVGHVLDASWALDRPDRQLNFAHRAVHLVTQVAKQVVTAAYGRPPTRTYFEGCSNGGRQGLMEAQRYPTDFDGIVAGAPALDWTRLNLAFVSNQQALAPAPLPPAKLPLLANAVLAQCDALDGLADGLVDTPRRCGFDPGVLACPSGAAAPDCLTPGELESARSIYRGPLDGAGVSLHPGFPPGAEDDPVGWQPWITGPHLGGPPVEFVIAEQLLRYFVFSDPSYDLLSFDLDRDAPRLEPVAELLDATDPDLSAFHSAGGKLIVWHGWADAGIPADRTVRYYHEVLDAFGARQTVRSFFRLFLAPGMGHCEGGPGPNSFDALTALERWVESGVAPSRIVAEHVGDGVARSRPLCAYPFSAVYDGSGDPNEAASFTCQTHSPATSSGTVCGLGPELLLLAPLLAARRKRRRAYSHTAPSRFHQAACAASNREATASSA